MKKRIRDLVPGDLPRQLEAARLDLLALFRAIDRLDLGAHEIPQEELHDLFELDGDLAEALAVLSQPARGLNVAAMLEDTLASLDRLPRARKDFLAGLAPRGLRPLAVEEARVRASLAPKEAYHSIPGHDS